MRSIVGIIAASVSITAWGGVACCQQQVTQSDQRHVLNSGLQDRRPSPRPSWMVEYRADTLEKKKDSWLRITFAAGNAQLTTPNAIIVSAHQIASIGFSKQANEESDRLQTPRSGCGYAKSMMPDSSEAQPMFLIANAAEPSLGLRFAEGLLRKHPVIILWNDETHQGSMTVGVNECEYEPFIANLRWLLGQQWNAVAHELSRAELREATK